MYVGMPWYHQDTYDRCRAVMEDGANFPSTYDAWLKKALVIEQSQKLMGGKIVRAYIDPDVFPAFCIANDVQINGSGRNLFANILARDQWLRDHGQPPGS